MSLQKTGHRERQMQIQRKNKPWNLLSLWGDLGRSHCFKDGKWGMVEKEATEQPKSSLSIVPGGTLQYHLMWGLPSDFHQKNLL